MNKGSHKFKVIIIAVVILTICFGVWWVYYKDNNTTQNDAANNATQRSDVNFFIKKIDNEIDKDGDGIRDSEEEAMGLDTADFDTDGDGISDKTELDVYNTDPTKSDTDGDGYIDGIEILNGYNPNGEGTL